MRVHSLQHVPFEGIGSLEQDIEKHAHHLTTTYLYRGDLLPSLSSFDVLIIMGGPMGVYDESIYPWLSQEKIFIEQAISTGKKIIGICLGAQLIACVLGAKVTRNPHREIGWFPLEINANAKGNAVAKILAQCGKVFHWHGDTFEIPARAQLIASSQACSHQAYVIDNQIYGFQFHLETTEESASQLIKNCVEELDDSTFVQSAQDIMRDRENFAAINKAMSEIFFQLLR